MKKILNFLKPSWVSEEVKEGTMAAADKKSAMRFCIGGTIIFVLIYAMMYFDLFNTYLNDYYVRSGFVAHLFSWISAIGSIIALWKSPESAMSEKKTWVGVSILILLAAAILFGAGFNFDLNGIE